MQPVELKRIPFLSAVPEEELIPWAEVATRTSVERRDTLTVAGDLNLELGLLARGLVILCVSSNDHEKRMTGIVDSSQCFNIECLHPRARATHSAYALTAAEVVSIPGAAVRAAVVRGGKLAALLSGFAAGRLAEVTDDLVRATTLDVRARAAAALLRLSDRLDTRNIPLTQEQLSGIVGTRRETLALILGVLRSEGVIDTRYRMIKILDRDRLLEATRNGYPTCIDIAVTLPLSGNSCL